MDDALRILNETGRWRTREVRYCSGPWNRVKQQIPSFNIADFNVEYEGVANPYLKTIVRQPLSKAERHTPVGIVSNTYTLAQHIEVAEKCLDGIRKSGVDTENLNCELGLTELGEWMNLRFYFPSDFDHDPGDGNKLGLRLECFNSVDGSSRLIVLLGWLRFVCSNGLVIGETKVELKDIHNKYMDLEKIPNIICEGLQFVPSDMKRLDGWQKVEFRPQRFDGWIDGELSKKWGKKAACRTYHICKSGFDVELTDPFAKGDASEKPIKTGTKVPGAARPARSLYDVSQALSWVAKGLNDPEGRRERQVQIPALIGSLQSKV
jgi:hypothetical protein